MTTFPGFSSRSSASNVQQFPNRDGAVMNGYNPEPGFSNSAGSEPDEQPAAEAKRVDEPEVEDKAVEPAAKTVKRTARKS